MRIALALALVAACDASEPVASPGPEEPRADAGARADDAAPRPEAGPASDAAGAADAPADTAMATKPDAAPTCPPPEPGAIAGALAWGEVVQQRMASAVVASFPIITPPDGKASIVFTQGQQPSTPAGVTTELSVSRCRGVIEARSTPCFQSTTFVNNNQVVAFTKPVNGWSDQATLGAQGCWAPEAEGPFYVNVRWTYPSCPFASCGFSLQWAFGAW